MSGEGGTLGQSWKRHVAAGAMGTDGYNRAMLFPRVVQAQEPVSLPVPGHRSR